MSAVVSLKGVTKKFGHVVAVNNINILINSKEVFGLLGPNGSGKTTTMRLILGILAPTKGEVKVLGYKMPMERDKAIKKIGYVPQRFSLYEDLTVLENLEFYGKAFGITGQILWSRIRELLEMFNLWEVRHRLSGKLSGGMKQRLAIATALIHDPELLILDEPTAGLDPPLRRYFWSLFRKLKDYGKTLIVTTHYMDEAERCDRLALMTKGRIAALGTPRELKRLAMGGDVVELLVNSKKALNTILEMNFVKKLLSSKPSTEGVKVKLIVEDASTNIPLIVKDLEDLGFKVLRAKEVFIEFEEVFIRLTGGEK